MLNSRNGYLLHLFRLCIGLRPFVQRITNVQHRLLIAMQNEQHWRQNLMHALSIAHGRLFASIAKQDVHHQSLNVVSSEKINARKCAHNVLTNNSVQFLVTKVLIPCGLLVLRKRIVSDCCCCGSVL